MLKVGENWIFQSFQVKYVHALSVLPQLRGITMRALYLNYFIPRTKKAENFPISWQLEQTIDS